MSPRPASAKSVLVAGCATLLLALAIHHLTRTPTAPPTPAAPAPAARGTAAPVANQAITSAPRDAADLARDLRAILAEPDPAKRQALLRAWADGIDSALMASVLAELLHIDDPALRNEARQALLYSWTSRDLVAVAKWFGTLGPAYDLQQEGRDQLVLALLQCDHDAVILALRESLPETTSRQLYGPYFRAWAAADPAAASAKLVELAAAEPGNPHLWHDLVSQVAARWAETDLAAAVDWVRALPASPARIKAELQTAYRWTEADPLAASAYAAGANNLQLVQTVAGQWAEADPAAALGWGASLPAGPAQTRALSGAAASWAQTDPRAAADYAARLGQPGLRAEVAAAVASAWAFDDPRAAGAWVDTLPADATRDSAVGVLCEALRYTAPAEAFAWANAITDATQRDHTAARVAVSWLRQSPDAARDAITRSTLSAELKSDIFAQATPPKPRG